MAATPRARRASRCGSRRTRRDPSLAVEQFDSLLEALVLIEDWRIEYNTTRPHSSLGWLSPAAYAERWRAKQLVGLS